MEYKFSSTIPTLSWSESMVVKARKRFAKFEKFLADDVVKFHIDEDGSKISLKIQAKAINHKIIRSEINGRSYAFDSLLTQAINALGSQAHRMKGKLQEKHEKIVEEVVEEVSPIAKETTIILDCITPIDAYNKMIDGGYTWYAFKNLEDNNNVYIINLRLEGNGKLIKLM